MRSRSTGQDVISNDFVAGLTKKFPDVFLPGWAVVDPWKGKIALAELERAIRDLGLIGPKWMPILQAFYPDDPKLYPFWDLCQSLGAPTLIHTGTTAIGQGMEGGAGLKLDYARPMPYIDRIAADFPRLTIVMAHPAWPWTEEAIAILLHKPNVYMDISGWRPRYIPEVLKYEMNRRLQDKIIFGSDYPGWSPQQCLDELEIEMKGFRPGVAEKIFVKNALRALKLEAAVKKARPPRRRRRRHERFAPAAARPRARPRSLVGEISAARHLGRHGLQMVARADARNSERALLVGHARGVGQPVLPPPLARGGAGAGRHKLARRYRQDSDVHVGRRERGPGRASAFRRAAEPEARRARLRQLQADELGRHHRQAARHDPRPGGVGVHGDRHRALELRLRRASGRRDADPVHLLARHARLGAARRLPRLSRRHAAHHRRRHRHAVAAPDRDRLRLRHQYLALVPRISRSISRKLAREEFGRDLRELKTARPSTPSSVPISTARLRRELEELYGCPVYDRYGMHEFGVGAFECAHQDGLHWMEDLSYISRSSTWRPAGRWRRARPG